MGITASSNKAIIEIQIIIMLFYLSFKTVISHFCAIHLCIPRKMEGEITFGTQFGGDDTFSPLHTLFTFSLCQIRNIYSEQCIYFAYVKYHNTKYDVFHLVDNYFV